MTLSPEVQEILDRVKSGESKYVKEREAPQKHVRSTPRQQLHREPTKPRGQANREKIVALYAENKTTLQVAEETGISRQTVIRHLKAAEVFEPYREGRSGRPLSGECARGHDQAIHRAESSPGKGDWHCGKCKLDSNKEYKKKTAAQRMDNRLELRKENQPAILILGGKQVGLIGGDWETLASLDAKLVELSQPRCRWH